MSPTRDTATPEGPLPDAIPYINHDGSVVGSPDTIPTYRRYEA